MNEIRAQFPFLNRTVNDYPIVYFDNAASSQKPQMVLDAIDTYYNSFNANVHRGIHTMSQEATIQMEESRVKLQKFINAKHPYEVIFTKGTTESINLLAHCLKSKIQKDDEIIITQLEHHSNIVPWQMLCEFTGAKLKFVPIDNQGVLQLDVYKELLNEKTKFVSFNQVSNSLGVINPIQEMINLAHEHNALVLVDGAQAAPHVTIDVQNLDADFYAFSGHKMYGPTGTGILYGKEHLLEELPPFLGGGEMIKEVSLQKTTYAELPFKFEAGTPNIAGNIVLGTAVDFMEKVGREKIQDHEKELLNYATEQLSQFEEVVIYAKETPRAGAISFNLNLNGVHSADVGMILDKKGIAVRTGHHCTQPLMNFFGIDGTVRASFAIYNTKEEIDQMVNALKLAIKMLG